MKKYDAYFDMITPIKYLNNKDSFTIARVIDGLHCIELHISNGVSTIEKGIRLEEDYEMLKKLWPKPIAKRVMHFYKNAVKTNS